ncbi:MAG: hypothetical protein WKG00_22515 [Polyangiaceae bacterium]
MALRYRAEARKGAARGDARSGAPWASALWLLTGAGLALAAGCGNLAGEDLFGYPDRLGAGGAGAEGGAGGDPVATVASSSSGDPVSSASSASASASAASSSVSSSSGATCPNGSCEAGETPESCPQDCPGGCDHPVCQDGGPLSSGCDPCVDLVCGADGFCCSDGWDGQCIGEANALCGGICCGDGACTGETCDNCAADCGACQCGDGQCQGETCDSCATDCGSCPVACPHTVCFVGEPLDGAACLDPCVDEVCDVDAACCMGNGDGWDDSCQDQAQTLCGTPDPCVAAVCAQMPSCCTGALGGTGGGGSGSGGAGGAGGGGGAAGTGGSGGAPPAPAWSAACVDLAVTLCNTGCNCQHSVCAQGGDLSPGCNPCAAAVCEADSYCCDSNWDGACVNEAISICGIDCL